MLAVAMVLLIFTPRIVLAVAVMHLALFGAVLAVRVDALRVAMGLRPLRGYAGESLAYPNMAAVPEEPSRPFVRAESRPRPFVSIHVPAHSEPPAVVCRTLDALARLRYEPLEFIVLDNNTPQPALWQPVEAHCRKLGRRFRFRHVEGLTGAKAGALNLCLQMTSPRSELICVVDADYQVTPSLVERALEALARGEAAAGQPPSHVQFPQAYATAGVGARGRGLLSEYAHYFDLYMPYAQATDSVLLTGTLSVVRRDALEAVGGWRADSITEDAELGLRLALAGHHGVFVPEVAGRGVMPTELGSLRRQRRRWAHGNAQVLVSLLRARQGRAWLRAHPRRALGVVAQLTAWSNFLFVPSAILLGLALSGVHDDAHVLLGTVAAASVFAALAGKLAVFAASPARVERGLARARLRALACHLGLLWEGATAWLEPLCGIELAFERTNKFAGRSEVNDLVPRLALATALALSAPLLMLHGLALGALAMLTLGASLAVGALVLHRELRAAATATATANRVTDIPATTRFVPAPPVRHAAAAATMPTEQRSTG